MAYDVALVRQPNGRYDLAVQRGDAVLTDDMSPQILRLLYQGAWIGDNGERSGEALPDVKFIDDDTKGRVQLICETRLGALLRRGDLDSVTVIDVTPDPDNGLVEFSLQYVKPGHPPKSLQVRLPR